MSGLIPYVDFADSKGPLLWLFYGLGNMLDPTGWNGTLLLFMVYYVFVLRMVWLSGRLMLGSERGAAFVVIAMSVAYWGIGHVENRAEDLAQLPLAYLVYLVLKAYAGLRITRWQYFWAGVGLGAMLFVKWNFPAMLMPLPLIALCLDAKGSWSRGVRSFRLGLSGVLAVALVISVWMLCAGAFVPMVEEYFLNTLATVDGNGTALSDVLNVIRTFLPRRRWLICYLVCVPAVTVGLYGRKGWLLPLAMLWMLFLSTLHYIPYYDRIGNTYMLFIPVAFLLLLSRMVRLRKWMLAAEGLLVVAALFHYTWVEYAPSDPLEKKRVELFSRMSDKVARLHAPRILYFDNPDLGLGVRSQGLPGSRYWAGQFGATPEMRREQKRALEECVPDVVLTDMDVTLPARYGYVSSPSDTILSPSLRNVSAYRVWFKKM